MKLITLSLISMALLLAGCPSTESENVSSEGIYAQYVVEDNGSTVNVSAKFWVGDGPGGTILDLTGNDQVQVNGRTMAKNKDLFGVVTYTNTLPKNEFYEFTFSREKDGDVDFYGASIQLPNAMQISSPKNGQRIRRGSSLNVRWRRSSNSEDQVKISITGSGDSADGPGTTSYVRSNSGIADDGFYTIPGGDTNPSSIKGTIHNVRVEVTRYRTHNLREFDDLNGTIEARTKSQATGLSFQ